MKWLHALVLNSVANHDACLSLWWEKEKERERECVCESLGNILNSLYHFCEQIMCWTLGHAIRMFDAPVWIFDSNLHEYKVRVLHISYQYETDYIKTELHWLSDCDLIDDL